MKVLLSCCKVINICHPRFWWSPCYFSHLFLLRITSKNHLSRTRSRCNRSMRKLPIRKSRCSFQRSQRSTHHSDRNSMSHSRRLPCQLEPCSWKIQWKHINTNKCEKNNEDYLILKLTVCTTIKSSLAAALQKITAKEFVLDIPTMCKCSNISRSKLYHYGYSIDLFIPAHERVSAYHSCRELDCGHFIEKTVVYWFSCPDARTNKAKLSFSDEYSATYRMKS